MKKATTPLLLILVASSFLLPGFEADILLPTLSDREDVEDALAPEVWINLTDAQRDGYAENGQACQQNFPIYAPQPSAGNGWVCVGFGSVANIACADAKGQALRMGDESCAGSPDDGEICYEMREAGEGWTTLYPTAGHVDTQGHVVERCDWPAEGTAYGCETALNTARHFDIPGTHCFSVDTTTYVKTRVGGVTLPSGVSTDIEEVLCP